MADALAKQVFGWEMDFYGFPQPFYLVFPLIHYDLIDDGQNNMILMKWINLLYLSKKKNRQC